MPPNDQAVLTAARGFIFTAPVGTAGPTPEQVNNFDPAVGFESWNNIGHTSRDELPEFGFDGGDVETRGTWQNDALKTVVTDPPVDYVVFNLHQFDYEGLSLYYGTGSASNTPGEFAVQAASTGATQRALLIVIVDGPVQIALYAHKTDLRREDSISLAVDEFAYLPIRATFLQDGAAPLFSWIGVDTGVNPG